MSSQPGRQVYVTMLTVGSELNACLHSGCVQKRTKRISASRRAALTLVVVSREDRQIYMTSNQCISGKI